MKLKTATFCVFGALLCALPAGSQGVLHDVLPVQNSAYAAITSASDFKMPSSHRINSHVHAAALSSSDFKTPFSHRVNSHVHEAATSLSTPPAVRKVPAQASPLSPQWSTDFTKQADFDLFTVIDANNDASPMTPGSSLLKEAWNYSYNKLYFYSDKQKADDYLVSPAFNLKAGHSYKVKYKINCFRPHKAEVKFGTAATVAGLTETALAEQTFKGKTTLEATLNPAADGVYYVALHCLSEKAGYNMYLENFSIEGMTSPKVPNTVQDIVVTPDASAALKATISFTAPSLAQDNTALTSLSGIRIFSEKKLLTTITDAVPGGHVAYTDEQVDSAGIRNYTLIAYNSFGDGVPATTSRWIGLDVPSAPQNRHLVAGIDQLSFSWDASVATNKGVIFPEKIKYNIFDVASTAGKYHVSNALGSVTGQTTFTTAMPTDEGEQHYHYLAIEAVNESGSSGYFISTPVLLGAAYKLPVRENFGDAMVDHWWGTSQTGNGKLYKPVAEAALTTETDGDGDGASLYLRTVMNDSVNFYSGKIALAGTVNPVLSFMMKSEADQGTFYPFVLLPDGTKEHLAALPVSVDTGWRVLNYSLEKYKSQRWIEIGFALSDPDGATAQVVRVDNVNVASKATTDVAVTASATKQLTKGEEATIRVKVDNYGASPLSAYRLKVTVGGQVVADRNVTEVLPQLGHHKFTFAYATTPVDKRDSLKVEVNVTAADDADNSNNSVEALIVQNNPQLVKAENLKITTASGQNQLTWTAPSKVKQVVDDFENYTPWAIDNIGKWTFVDGDKANNSGLVDEYHLYYENEGKPFAYIVFNPSQYGEKGSVADLTRIYPRLATHSGSQCLAALYGYVLNSSTYDYDLANADDWLISPELPGVEQTIMFSANNFYENGTHEGKPYEFDYPETFDVLYSTTGNNIADFLKTGDTHTLKNGQWQSFMVRLPQGTRYFAIHHNSKAQQDADGYVISPYLFSIDDVFYTVANEKVLKYNIYRDGAFIASSPTPAYNDTDDGHSHQYMVTVVYEGNLESNPVEANTATGIRNMSQQAAGSTVVAVYTLDGKRVGTMSHGIYIVKYKDGSVRKMVVK